MAQKLEKTKQPKFQESLTEAPTQELLVVPIFLAACKNGSPLVLSLQATRSLRKGQRVHREVNVASSTICFPQLLIWIIPLIQNIISLLTLLLLKSPLNSFTFMPLAKRNILFLYS